MCKNRNNLSANIACLCTCIWFIIAICLMITHIVHFEDKTNKYGELALFSLGIGFILWIVRVNIKEEEKGITKVHPVD